MEETKRKYKYNEGVRYIQNISFSRGPVTINDLINSKGQPFTITYPAKVDLLDPEEYGELPGRGLTEEQIESSLDLFNAIEGEMVAVIDEALYSNSDPNANHPLVQPVPKWEIEAEDKDLRHRGTVYQAPPNEYDYKLKESIDEEEEEIAIEQERQKGVMQIPDVEEATMEYVRRADKRDKLKKEGKAYFGDK